MAAHPPVDDTAVVAGSDTPSGPWTATATDGRAAGRRLWTARGLGGIAAAVGAVVLLVGWAGGAYSVTTVLPGLESMKANTAAGIVGLGLAGALAGRRRAQLVVVLVPVVLGGLSWWQYLAGVDLGIDELVFTDPVRAGFPGRMGLNTAISFTTLGLGWILAGAPTASRAKHLLGQALGAFAVTLALFAFLGYLYDATSARGIGSATEMALHTSVCVVLAGAALLAFTSVRGPLAVAWSHLAGGRVARTLLMPSLLVIVAAGVVGQLLVAADLLGEIELQLVFQVTLTGLVLTALILVVAWRVDALSRRELRAREEADTARARMAELVEQLERLNATLEERVADRTKELEQTVEALARANDDLQQFIYAASHDLREPMRMVALYTERLVASQEQPDGRQQRYVEFITEGVQRMAALMDGVTAYSRAGSGEVTLGPVDLDVLVRRSAARSGGLVDGLVIPQPLGALRTDEERLEEVLVEVFGNAVRHSIPDQQLEIEVTAATLEDGRHVLRVTDNGAGIPEGQHDRALQMFTRLHTRPGRGSGTGLAVARRTIRRLGGDLVLRPAETGGTMVAITLPERGLTVDDPPAAQPRALTRPARVLVVDDNHADQVMLQEGLREVDSAVDCLVAADGDVAMEMLERMGREGQLPDLVLLDLNMPRMDGFEVLRRIRASEELELIPVVVVTSSTAPEDVVRAYRLRANAYLAKPMTVNALEDMMARLERFWLSLAVLPRR